MRTLHFDYDMRIGYAEEVRKCYFTMRCMPGDTERQRVEELSVALEPAADWEEGGDSFGNRLIYGRLDESHRCFSCRVTGKAVTGLADQEAAEAPGEAARFRYPGSLTVPGEGLLAYWEKLKLSEAESAYGKGVILMERLHQDFSYEKNVTGVRTSAEEAWKGGRGVCQDYAHIMVALCRLQGIPARYVTGMLMGEGSSHAWVEILSRGKWYGLDPTNNLAVGEEHIRIGAGRDAADCPINRGLLTGGGRQTQEVCVKVEEA